MRPRYIGLSPTEQRVAELVAEGLTNPQIAERMFLSRRTVQNHISNAFQKLNMHSRVQLALHIQAQRGTR